MRVKTTKVVVLVLLTVLCSVFSNQELLAYVDGIEALFKNELDQYKPFYTLVHNQEEGGIITRRYKGYSTETLGNTCSVYIEVRKKYTLTITVNRETKEVSSNESNTELSRELINGLR